MEGRNFDYGHQASDSKEGQMAKRALLTMAKDLYNLYITLNDHDDLPEWCHYKLATSRKDLSDITDYLTSKVMKHCLDKEMGYEDLRLEIKKSMVNDLLAESNLNEFFFGKKGKKKPDNSFSKEYLPKSAAHSDFRKDYQNQTVHFITTAREIARRIKSYERSNLDLDIIELFKGDVRLKVNLQVINTEILTLKRSIEEMQNNKSFKPKVTSARISPKKKSFFSRLFNSNESVYKEEKSNIEQLIKRCYEYMLDVEQYANRDLKQIIAFKDEKTLELLKTQLNEIYKTIFNFLNKVEKDYSITRNKER
jgi:hypothetical protein